MLQKMQYLLILSIVVMIYLLLLCMRIDVGHFNYSVAAVDKFNYSAAVVGKFNYSAALKYYYYENATYFESLEYFKSCGTAAWPKNSPEHFFIKQLIYNDNINNIQSKHRVYDCFMADIYIIPISFGNAARRQCGNGNDQEFAEIVSKIPSDIFYNPQSCWNTNIKSRKYHYMNVGGIKGRDPLISMPRKEIWGQLILGDQAMIPSIMKAYNYNNNTAIKHKPCWISYGYTSIVSDLLRFTEHINVLNKTLVLNQTDIDREKKLKHLDLPHNHIHELPSINYRNRIKFVDRKYGTFFMGHAFAKRYYKLRARGVETAYSERNEGNNSNVWITTPSRYENQSHHEWFNECRFDSNYNLNNASFPCHISVPDRMLYFQLLSNSKFNLMLGGGDSCSSRFYDALSLNVINIVICDFFIRDCLIGNVFDEVDGTNGFIPWSDMFLQINSKIYSKNPTQSIENAINRHDDAYYQHMIQTIDKYKKYILWDRSDSESAMYIMKKALHKCYN